MEYLVEYSSSLFKNWTISGLSGNFLGKFCTICPFSKFLKFLIGKHPWSGLLKCLRQGFSHWIDFFWKKVQNPRILSHTFFNSCTQEFAELNSMCWLETSAKDCTNVQEAFETMAYKLCENHEQYLSFDSECNSGPGSFTLHGAYGVPEQPSTSYCGCTST